MSLAGIPGVTPAFDSFVQTVRLFLRDFPELNRLLRGVESSDRMIAWAVVDALSNFNGTPHITYCSLEDVLAMNQHYLMVRLTTISLLESVGQLQTRNHMNYSDGGLNVGVNDKTPLLQSWLQMFQGTIEQKMQRVKVSMNISSILNDGGSLHSEYWAINACYAAY